MRAEGAANQGTVSRAGAWNHGLPVGSESSKSSNTARARAGPPTVEWVRDIVRSEPSAQSASSRASSPACQRRPPTSQGHLPADSADSGMSRKHLLANAEGRQDLRIPGTGG